MWIPFYYFLGKSFCEINKISEMFYLTCTHTNYTHYFKRNAQTNKEKRKRKKVTNSVGAKKVKKTLRLSSVVPEA